jgi:hypothetical protein
MARGGLVGKMMQKGAPSEMPEGPMAGSDMGLPPEDEMEEHGGAVELLDNALDDLKQLAPMIPDIDRLMARLESLRPKAEEYDKGGAAPGEADLESMPANPGRGPKGY